MPSQKIEGILVTFDSAEQETGEIISRAAGEALRVIRETWGWNSPQDCRMYVMTSWWSFFFQSAPWSWRVLLALTVPLWALRAQMTWPISAAWTQRYGRRVVIGIKPPHLLEVSDKSIGVQMYIEEKDMPTKLRHLVCHELTHACSTDLRLPAWLNEGLAAVTVERFLGKRIIHPNTLALVREFKPKEPPPGYREMVRMEKKAIAYHAVRGYWLVRYLEEKQPGLLKRLVSAQTPIREIEEQAARALGREPKTFWKEIDSILAAQSPDGSEGQPSR